MRGYETAEIEGIPVVNPSYESPCGVMSFSGVVTMDSLSWLRIPMRGYETTPATPDSTIFSVTNPHAGL